MCGHIREVVIYSKFHRNPFSCFGATGSRHFSSPSPVDLGIDLYNSLYTSHDKATLRCVALYVCIAGYLHQVRSYGRSISSTNHFAPSPDLNFTDCISASPSNVTHVTLGQVQFMWSYVNGHLVSRCDLIVDKYCA